MQLFRGARVGGFGSVVVGSAFRAPQICPKTVQTLSSIIILELFRWLQLQLSEVLQFPCFSCRMHLQQIIPVRNSQEFSAITVTWFNAFRIKNVMISKRMVQDLGGPLDRKSGKRRFNHGDGSNRPFLALWAVFRLGAKQPMKRKTGRT